MISAFDLFKIGIGPSSSHTVGPMVAAHRFRGIVETASVPAHRLTASLHGSLAWTGHGHASDVAICLGFLGLLPGAVDPDAIPRLIADLHETRHIQLRTGAVHFDPAADIRFDYDELLPVHTNGMRFRALDPAGAVLAERVLYSIGGGFVVDQQHMDPDAGVDWPQPFHSAAELLQLCRDTGLDVAALQLENETRLRSPAQIESGLDAIQDAMFACIDRGLRGEGALPGKLRVRRRAKDIYAGLLRDRERNDRPAHEVMDWVSTFAIAVNEENASGGRVVTAPTNGAAGVIPAVMRYGRDFCAGWTAASGRSFLLTASAIGGLIKRRASISGAEVGCQGEVGSAAAMAAAGLAAVLGGTPGQVENAAEIAMEHHLGMTCDPIGGLVQIPCIERNAMGANKAIVAASLALRGDGSHRVSLDEVIETMRQTGADMQTKYKETSQGGLAVNVSEC
ncbi:MAG: L-serine ammonia-lyase [Acetobacteraceae bacterium]